MSQALALVSPSSGALELKPQLDLNAIEKYAGIFQQSGFFSGVTNAAQAMVKIIAGQEFGMTPFEAMSDLHIIKGKITLSANAMAKKIKASGRYDYRVIEHNEKVCELEFFENGQSLGRSRFTIEDAKKAQSQNLDKFPRNMLFARAISNGLRWYCPDAINGPSVYTPEDFDDAQVQPLRVVSSQPEITKADLQDAGIIDATPMLDESYVEGIVELAKQTNTPLDPVLKRAGVRSVASLSQEQADKTFDWLKKKADALAQKPDDPAAFSADVADDQHASGLDQWACTKETGTRALAMNVITVWDEAKEKLSLTDDQLRDELGNECAGITSRKELSAAQAQHFITFLRDFIAATN